MRVRVGSGTGVELLVAAMAVADPDWRAVLTHGEAAYDAARAAGGRDLDPDTRHVVMDDDDVVVGCARVLDDGDTWRIGRVALHPTVRGRGLADALLHTALQVCRDRDVVLDAQVPLAGWYATFGFVLDGEEFLEDGIPHQPMRLPQP